jgi:hypothetical protein
MINWFSYKTVVKSSKTLDPFHIQNHWFHILHFGSYQNNETHGIFLKMLATVPPYGGTIIFIIQITFRMFLGTQSDAHNLSHSDL